MREGGRKQKEERHKEGSRISGIGDRKEHIPGMWREAE
jgi:hypothetical protein